MKLILIETSASTLLQRKFGEREKDIIAFCRYASSRLCIIIETLVKLMKSLWENQIILLQFSISRSGTLLNPKILILNYSSWFFYCQKVLTFPEFPSGRERNFHRFSLPKFCQNDGDIVLSSLEISTVSEKNSIWYRKHYCRQWLLLLRVDHRPPSKVIAIPSMILSLASAEPSLAVDTFLPGRRWFGYGQRWNYHSRNGSTDPLRDVYSLF